jgi:hypothetical protein
MNVGRRNGILFGLTLVFALLGALPLARAEEPDTLLREVQGKWTRRLATPQGQLRIVKEHKGNRTIVTAYDDKENVVYSHQSEFTVAQSGKVRILTFSNREITAGAGAGAKFVAPVSFVYRVAGDRFIETHGLLDDEATAPTMIVWERANE